MKLLICSMSVLLSAIPSSASKPKPYFRECRLIDTIAESAKNESDDGQSLKYLERLADGEAPEPDPTAVKALGFSSETLRGLSLQAPGVRAYAFLAIGTLGGPEAVRFLSAKTKSNFDPAVPELWHEVQVSVHAALLGQLSDRQSIENSLETTLAEASGYIANWAVEEACNRGLASTLPFVRESIRKRDSSDRSEFEIRFCEERIEILSRSSRRSEALSSYLTAGALSSDERLVPWAMTLLSRDDPAEAARAIDVFRSRISAMPKDDPVKQRFEAVLFELALFPPLKRPSALKKSQD